MFGPPGHAYIYFIYGMYYCLNAVTRPEGVAEAVLLRAIEPIAECLGEGDGPGKLCRALSVDRRLNGADLCSSELFIAPPIRPVPVLARGPRVGVAYAKGWARRRLRFWERGSPFVSRAGGARSS
jgi:DNA-3-methyladenine glycosylase